MLDTRDLPRMQKVATILGCQQPIEITDEMEKWPGFGKWNLRYFEERYGNLMISADRIENGKQVFVSLPLRQFIHYTLTTSDLNPFYAKTCLHLISDLQNDFVVPAIFQCWYRDYYHRMGLPRKMELSNLYIGPRYSRSKLHRDMWSTSFWNALFNGRKLWVFIPKEQEQYIYDGQIDPFFPDYERFPNYRLVTPQWHIQYPGEILFCPGKIWHTAMVLEPSIALSENIINGDDYMNVREFFQAQGYASALKKLEDIISFQVTATS